MKTKQAAPATPLPVGERKYRISYIYESPSPAGPFKGRTVMDYKPAKGDSIRAMFGSAIVKSVREVKS